MGIYYKLINASKKEYLDPYDLGEGLKGRLLFQTWTHRCLIWLLQDNESYPHCGSWSNDALKVVGDYRNEYEDACEENGWVNVTHSTVLELCEQYGLRDEFLTHAKGELTYNPDLASLIKRLEIIDASNST